jgi:hypothetical protein
MTTPNLHTFRWMIYGNGALPPRHGHQPITRIWHDCNHLIIEITSPRPYSVMMPNLFMFMQAQFDLPSLQARGLFHQH